MINYSKVFQRIWTTGEIKELKCKADLFLEFQNLNKDIKFLGSFNCIKFQSCISTARFVVETLWRDPKSRRPRSFWRKNFSVLLETDFISYFIFMHTRTHTHMQTYTNTHVQTYIYIYIYISVWFWIYRQRICGNSIC